MKLERIEETQESLLHTEGRGIMDSDRIEKPRSCRHLSLPQIMSLGKNSLHRDARLRTISRHRKPLRKRSCSNSNLISPEMIAQSRMTILRCPLRRRNAERTVHSRPKNLKAKERRHASLIGPRPADLCRPSLSKRALWRIYWAMTIKTKSCQMLAYLFWNGRWIPRILQTMYIPTKCRGSRGECLGKADRPSGCRKIV